MSYKLAKKIPEINHPIIGFDIETSPYDEFKNQKDAALDETKSFIAGFSVAVPDGDAWYFPLGHREHKNIDLEDAKQFLSRLSASSLFVIHNTEFEMRFLRHHAFPLPKQYVCTLTLAKLLRLHSAGLKYIANTILGKKREKFEKIAPDGCFADLKVTKKVIDYACGDADDALQFYLLVRDKIPEWMRKLSLPKEVT